MGDEFKAGERVKATIEGSVTSVDSAGAVELRVVNKYGLDSYLSVDPATVEKVKPPVEVFKPGDVVRDRDQGTVRTLATDGWIRHDCGEFYSNPSQISFTSEYYERVEV